MGRGQTGGSSSLDIRYDGARYHVSVSPPHASDSHEVTIETPTEVLELLSRWGCHSTDIRDALYEANPAWAVVHDAEVLRRRAQGSGE